MHILFTREGEVTMECQYKENAAYAFRNDVAVEREILVHCLHKTRKALVPLMIYNQPQSRTHVVCLASVFYPVQFFAVMALYLDVHVALTQSEYSIHSLTHLDHILISPSHVGPVPI